MKITDTRSSVLAEIEASPDATRADIARRVGVSKQRVHQILKGMGKTPTGMRGSALGHRVEYKCWHNLIARCIDPTHQLYHHYGARGITVCSRWLNSFPSFLTDMGVRPSVDHSIDRINNDGNYEPGNCRWATKSQQVVNRRKKTVDKDHARRIMARALRADGFSIRQIMKLCGWKSTQSVTKALSDEDA